MREQETGANDLLARWADAVSRCDVAAVTATYHPQAQFWGTFAGHLRTSGDDISHYFEHFLDHECMTVDLGPAEFSVQPGGRVLVAGEYQFCWQDEAAAAPVCARARYTMVLCPEASGWQILQHHSSGWVDGGI